MGGFERTLSLVELLDEIEQPVAGLLEPEPGGTLALGRALDRRPLGPFTGELECLTERARRFGGGRAARGRRDRT